MVASLFLSKMNIQARDDACLNGCLKIVKSAANFLKAV